MYQRWFDLEELPFRLRPDPAFFFLAGSLAEHHGALCAALLQRQGPVSVTGEAGVGKSTLVQAATGAAGAAGQNLIIAQLLQPGLTVAEMYGTLFGQLGIDVVPTAHTHQRAGLLAFIAAQRASGKNTLLVADDVHQFVPAVLAELTDLAAQPNGPNLLLAAESDLTLNINVKAAPPLSTSGHSFHLTPFDADQTCHYIAHRLRIAGAGARELFGAAASAEVFRFAGGLPRLVNTLCDAALTAAAEHKARTVSQAEVQDAARHLRWSPFPAVSAATASADSLSGQTGSYWTRAFEPRLAIAVTGRQLSRVALHTGRLMIGRGTECGLRLESPHVSRVHCQIVTGNDACFVEDLGSTNGVYLNGHLVSRSRLKNQDVITVGKHTLTFSLGIDAPRH